MLVPHVISRATLPTALHNTNLDASRRISTREPGRQSRSSHSWVRPSRYTVDGRLSLGLIHHHGNDSSWRRCRISRSRGSRVLRPEASHVPP
ncbi:hypothetical protein IG631_21276 [Alternaria alternata]|nr:hypothetical protein IG631_21276 [Alternaria alternata]